MTCHCCCNLRGMDFRLHPLLWTKKEIKEIKQTNLYKGNGSQSRSSSYSLFLTIASIVIFRKKKLKKLRTHHQCHCRGSLRCFFLISIQLLGSVRVCLNFKRFFCSGLRLRENNECNIVTQNISIQIFLEVFLKRKDKIK